MQHGHGGILLDCWNEGAWSLRAARAELGMAMALELLEVVIGSGAGRRGEVVERWMDGSMELAGFGRLV